MRVSEISISRWWKSLEDVAGQYTLACLVGGCGGLLVLLLGRASATSIAMALMITGGLVALLALREVRGPCLALLVFSLPLHLDAHFMFRSRHLGGPSGFRVTAGDIVLLILLYLWLSETALGRRKQIRLFANVTLPALLFVALALVSGLFAQEPLFTAFQLFELAKGLIIYLYVANQVQGERDVKWVLVGLMASVLLQSALGLYQGILHRPLGLTLLGEGSLRVGFMFEDRLTARSTGTLWHPNILGMYLGMTLPILAGVLFVPASRVLTRLAGLVTLVGLAASAYTLSRAAWFGMLLSAMTLLALSPRSGGSTRLRRICLGLSALLVVLLVFNLISGGVILLRLTQDDRGAAQARVPLMRGALAIIADYPLFGSGLNNYQYAIETYYRPGELTGFATLSIVHNVFLLLAAETGLLGLGAFVWLLVALGKRGLVFLRQHTNDLPAGLTLGLLAGGQHLIVHNMVDYGLVGDPQIFSLFWFLAGLLVALTARATTFEDVVVREDGTRRGHARGCVA